MRTGTGRARRSLLAALAGALILSGLAGCEVGQASAGQVQWRQVWADTFNGPAGSRLDPRHWTYDTGHSGFGNHEVEAMTQAAANVHLNGRGALDITALGHAASWTSGRVETRSEFRPPAGGLLRVVASIRQPGPASGLGYWPAFWLLGPGRWPQHGEIDILEDVNGLSRHSGTLHCGNLTQRNGDGTYGPCHESSGLGSGLRPCPGCQRGFHTYSVIIDRTHPGDESIRWYLDRHEFFSVNEHQVGRAAWDEAVHSGYSIIFDLAMGGAYPDYECRCRAPGAGTTSGGTMTVRYVGVFTRG